MKPVFYYLVNKIGGVWGLPLPLLKARRLYVNKDFNICVLFLYEYLKIHVVCVC